MREFVKFKASRWEDQGYETIEVLTDCYITQTYEGRYEDDLILISLYGFDSQVRAAVSALVAPNSRFEFQLYPSGYCKKIRRRLGGGYNFFTTKLGDYTHSLVVAKEALSPEGDIILAPGRTPEDALYEGLIERFTVPLKPEWKRYLWNEMSVRFVEELSVWNSGPKQLTAIRLTLTESVLENFISNQIKYGSLAFGPYDDNLGELEAISGLDDYLKQFGQDLAHKITNRFTPLHNPETNQLSPFISKLKVSPFRAQADVIQAGVQALKKQDSFVIVGEMGCGKTLMAAGIPYVAEQARAYRTLVMCPGHLTRKWAREVTKTIPKARATIIENWTDVLKLQAGTKPFVPEYYIISKERAKLSYAWRPAYVYHPHRDLLTCPTCGQALTDRDGVALTKTAFTNRTKANSTCPNCKGLLWQADREKIRRFAPAEYIKKHLKGFFDYFIGDEMHEYKGGNTAQGNAFGMLAASCRKTIALTGTLLGGYSSNLFYLLYRLNPGNMKKEQLSYSSLTQWIRRYGVLETVTFYDDADYNVFSRGNKSRVSTKERPGVSPLVFARHLMGQTAFLQLDNLGEYLPPYNEEVRLISMDNDLHHAYNDLYQKLYDAVRQNIAAGGKRLLASYLINLLSYPDRPWENPPVHDPKDGSLIVVPEELDKSQIRPKEAELLKLVTGEVRAGRRVMVYAQFTNRRDVTEHLASRLRDAHIRTTILKASVTPAKREQWLEREVAKGAQCVIANPQLVETGLDLTGNKNFPTIIFYQTGYNLFTLRQASRRSWRIGQHLPVNVYFLAYENTIQAQALQLMGQKMEAAMALEGKFSDEGLQALAGGVDMTTALAKAMLSGLKGVDSADAIWARLNADRAAENAEIAKQAIQPTMEPMQSNLFAANNMVSSSPEDLEEVEFYVITKTDLKSMSASARKKTVAGQMAFFSMAI